MSWKEKERLRVLLKYLDQQQIADQYHDQLFNQNSSILPTTRRQSKIEVSNRLRDEQGRFLPYNFQTIKEYESILDNEIDLSRKIKMEPILGSYNSYVVNEKEKRDWSGNIYLGCVAAIIVIAFFA